MRTTKSSKNIYFSIEKKVRNISVKPENDQNSYATQIENIFKQNKIDENNQEILFQNELFRKLLKGLNEILDEKIQKRTNKFQNQKLTEKPDVSNDITLNKEFKKNQTIIKRQNKEFLKLETRFSQIQEGEGDYLENLENEIKKMKNDLEMKKKEKRNQFDSTKLNAKVLEDIVEVKGMPENLQKSSVIDSDLSILMVKKKNLKKKLEKNRIDFEFLEKKVEKIEEDFIVSMKEAYDLKISFEKNDHKLNYEKLSLKIIRFKQCIQQITSTNKKILKKSENENEVLKVKLQEMESKVTEKNLALDEIRQKLSKVLSSDNIDKNLKGMLDLFTRNQNQNYSEVSPTSSLKVSAQTNVILKNHEDLLRDVILNKEEIIPANKEKIKINKEFKNENNLIESNEKKLKLNYNLSDSKKMKDAEDFTKEKKKKNNKLNEPDDFKNENIHYKKEETTPKKETQIHQKNEKVDRFENGENEKEIPVKSEEFYEIETFNANFKRGDSEKKLEIEKINFEPVFIRGEKNSENPIKILEEHFKEQIKDMPENKKEDSFEIKKNILEIKKNDDDANKKDQKNDKFENNKNEVRTELFNSKKLKSKPLKKIKNEGFFLFKNLKI